MTNETTDSYENFIGLPVDDLPEEDSADNAPGTFYEIFKKISLLSIPMALSYTFSLEVFLTTIMLSLLNPDDEKDIAATTLIATMMNTAIILGFSPLFGMSIVASKKIGELKEAEDNLEDEESLTEKRDYIAAFNRNGLLISAALTAPVAASLYFSKTLLADIFGQDEVTAQIAQNFLRTYSFAVPGLMARMCFEQMMFSFGRPKPAMLMGLTSLAVGTSLSAVLGFGDFGVKRLGPTGVAVGYVVEAYLTALFYAWYIGLHKEFKQFNFFNFCKHVEKSREQLKDLLKIGGPISFGVANELVMSLSMGIMAGLVGTREQAALTSAMQCVFFSFIPLAAFGQACSQEVSREIGAKNYENASRMGKYGLLTAIGYIAPIPLVCAIQPSILTFAIGGNEENSLPILKYLMPIISAGVICDTARYNILQQLRALGDLKVSTILSVGGLTVGTITGGVLGLKTRMGIYSIAAGYTGGIILAGAGLGIRWFNRIQTKKIREINNPESVKISHAKNSPRFFAATQQAEKVVVPELKEALVITTSNRR